MTSFAMAVIAFSAFTSTAFAREDSCSDHLKRKDISEEWIAKQRERTEAISETLKRLRSAAQTTSFNEVALNRQVLAEHNSGYTFELKDQCVTDQFGTGRCWIFAAQSVMRASIMRTGLLPPDFEISESYVWFFSLLEQANSHLESLFKNLYRKIPASELRLTAIAQIDEGGFFATFDEMVRKYGVVPKAAMNETSGSLDADVVVKEIELVLNQFGVRFLETRAFIDELKKLRGGSIDNESYDAIQNRMRIMKTGAMEAVWDILVTHLGVPPKKFKLRLDKFNEKSKNKQSPSLNTKSKEAELTPKELLKLTGYENEEWIVLANYSAKEMNQRYRLPEVSTAIPGEGEDLKALEFFNVPVERMIELTKTALEAGFPVEFDADIGSDTDYKSGILHTDIYRKDAVYGGNVNREELKGSRAKLAQFGMSDATHAMVFVGYDQPDPDQPITKFKVQNSWGTDIADKGFFHLYRNWFEKYVFHIAIPKRLLDEEELEAYENAPEDVEWYQLLYK